ncbi:MAG: hypothetical protein GC161_04345 [Planctomycetaceae bacterium]|nr:hypothetical protein [Planctomycetaceae bacterium]
MGANDAQSGRRCGAGRATALLSALGLCLGASQGAAPLPTAPQHVDNELAREVHATVARNEALSHELRRVVEERDRWRQDSVGNRQQLERELADARASATALRDELQKFERLRAAADLRAGADGKRIAAATDAARDLAARLALRLQHAVPSLRRRARDFAEVSARLEFDGTESVDALLDLHRLAEESLRLGRERTALSRLVPIPGTDREKHAWVVRLGGVLEFYVTEDREFAATASREGDGAGWRELPIEWAEAVDSAAEVLRGRAGATMVTLPVGMESLDGGLR